MAAGKPSPSQLAYGEARRSQRSFRHGWTWNTVREDGLFMTKEQGQAQSHQETPSPCNCDWTHLSITYRTMMIHRVCTSVRFAPTKARQSVSHCEIPLQSAPPVSEGYPPHAARLMLSKTTIEPAPKLSGGGLPAWFVLVYTKRKRRDTVSQTVGGGGDPNVAIAKNPSKSFVEITSRYRCSSINYNTPSITPFDTASEDLNALDSPNQCM